MQQHKLNLKRLYSTANVVPSNNQWVHTVAERFQLISTADATYLVTGEGSRELTQQATNLHVRPPFCELRYTDVHKRVTDTS